MIYHTRRLKKTSKSTYWWYIRIEVGRTEVYNYKKEIIRLSNLIHHKESDEKLQKYQPERQIPDTKFVR